MFARLAAAALIAAAPLVVQAQDVTALHAAALASDRAERAEARLSQRYAEIWATLDAEARAAFAAAERRWLNVQRFDEQSRCVAQRPSADRRAIAECRAAVAEQHLGTLERVQLAVKN